MERLCKVDFVMDNIVNAGSSGRNYNFIIQSTSRKHGLDWLFFSPNCFCSTLEKVSSSDDSRKEY